MTSDCSDPKTRYHQTPDHMIKSLAETDLCFYPSGGRENPSEGVVILIRNAVCDGGNVVQFMFQYGKVSMNPFQTEEGWGRRSTSDPENCSYHQYSTSYKLET